MTADPATVIHRADGGVPALGPYLRRLAGYRSFTLELSRAEVEAGHADTVLGRLWSVLNPLLLAGVYFLLLTVVRGGRAGDIGFVALVGGVFAYTWTANTLNGAKTSILRGARLVLSSSFPRMVLPLTATLTAARLYVPALVVLGVLHVATGRPLTANLLWLPLLLVLQGVAGLGLALLVSVANVAIRDLGNVLRYVLRLTIYATPVLFSVAALTDIGLRWLLWANPVGGAIGAQQQVLAGLAPSADLLVAAAGWAIGLLGVGARVFLRLEHTVAPRL